MNFPRLDKQIAFYREKTLDDFLPWFYQSGIDLVADNRMEEAIYLFRTALDGNTSKRKTCPRKSGSGCALHKVTFPLQI